MRCISLLKPGVHLLSITPEVKYHTASTVRTFMVGRYALHAAQHECWWRQQVEAEEMNHPGLAVLAPAYSLERMVKGQPGETQSQRSQRKRSLPTEAADLLMTTREGTHRCPLKIFRRTWQRTI